MIPRPLRERVGLRPGVVEVVADGAGVRVEPLATDSVVEQDGRLVIPAAGAAIGDGDVQALRDGDQR